MSDQERWTAADRQQMERALALAERGRGRTSPNPAVGAVVVDGEGVVVGAGYHERAGLAHAEVIALDQAGPRARGATLYCTLEPCCHAGRTGPCASRIVEAGVTRVVAAVEDPNPLVSGGGFRFLSAHAVDVATGLGREAAVRLNHAFFTFVRHRRPFVILKIATSADGRVSAAPGRRTALTSSEARQHVHALRAEVDALAIGSTTILVDDPLLTARAVYRPRPFVRVIFDRRLRTPPSARVFSTLGAGPVIIMTARALAGSDRARALADAGASVVATDGTVTDALRRLNALHVTSLVIEGGPVLHAAAWDEAVVDFVQVYVAPTWLGDPGVPVFDGRRVPLAGLFDARVEALGADVLISGYVHRID